MSSYRFDGLAFVAIFLATSLLAAPDRLRFVVALVLALLLIWASLSDLATHELPNAATALVALTGVTMMFARPDGSATSSLSLAAAILLGLGWLSGLYWSRYGREALGLGDVKLLAAGALVVGADRFWQMLLFASVGGIVAAVLSPSGRKDGIPFGPFIAYSILVTFSISGRLL